VESSLPALKNAVQERINRDLPAHEQRELMQCFCINLPVSTFEALEEYLATASWMEGLRDGDSTVTLRQKAFGTLLVAAQDYFHQELIEAKKYREAREAEQNGGAGAAEGDPTVEDEGCYDVTVENDVDVC
jgi:hypothetical protein